MYDSWVACRHTPGSTIKTSTIKVIYHNNRPDDAAVSHITQSLHELWPARLVACTTCGLHDLWDISVSRVSNRSSGGVS